MPYTMSIYPDEVIPKPKIGDVFVVQSVQEGVLDLRWGRHTFVELTPAETCEWTIASKYYPIADTACGLVAVDILDGTGKYCHNCGKQIVVKEPTE